MKFARIIFANLLRKKIRFLLTIGSFAVALVLFVFLGVLKQAFHFWSDAAKADRVVVINRMSYFNSMPVSYKDRIQQIPGVKYITHTNWFPGAYQDGREAFPQFAIDPEGQRLVYPELVVPEGQWQAFLKDRQGAIAGVKTAERFHWSIGDRIPLTATQFVAGTWEMNLDGVYHGKNPQDDDTQLWIRWDYFDEKVPGYMKGQVGWYVVRVEDPSESLRIAKEIDAAFANSPTETKSQVESAFAGDMMKQFTNIQSLILMIGGVVLFTLVLVTGNTMAIAVRERRGELAIFRALGFSDMAVLRFVVTESLVTALIGCTLGLVLVGFAIPALEKAMRGILPSLFLTPRIVVFGVSVALLVGVISGFVPGFLATRMRVVNALRKV